MKNCIGKELSKIPMPVSQRVLFRLQCLLTRERKSVLIALYEFQFLIFLSGKFQRAIVDAATSFRGPGVS